MSVAGDLTTLDKVKPFCGAPAGSGSDAVLASLITQASVFIRNYTGRPFFLPTAVSEVQDGRGDGRLVLRRFPVLSLSSIKVGGTAVTVAPALDPALTDQSGYVLDAWDGNLPGNFQALSLRGLSFAWGVRNVEIIYVAGYAVTNEAATIPGTPYEVTPAAPLGRWGSDRGVTLAGVAMTKVAAAPAAGQYMVDTVGKYTFAAADTTKAVLISYGFIPADIEQACIELVAERFTYMGRPGLLSKALGGQETIVFNVRSIPQYVETVLAGYRVMLGP